MKNLLDYIQDSPHLFITFLGISQRDFESLVQQVQRSQEAEKASSELTQHQVNARGAGRPAKLDLSKRLTLCLVYLRHNPIFEMLALLFGVSRSQAHQTFHENSKWICQLLPASLFKQFESNPELWELHPEILQDELLIVDSTEHSCEWPLDPEIQRGFFSSKKQHTLKSFLIVTSDGLEIVDVILGVPGPRSDIILFREQQHHLSSEQAYLGDKACVGAARTTTPMKNRETEP